MTAVRSVIASSGRCARKSAEPSAFAASARRPAIGEIPSCLPELLDRQLELAGTERGLAQLVGKHRFELRRRRLRERSLEVRDGNVRGAAIACAPGRLSQRVDRLRIAAGMGRQEVDGDPIRCFARGAQQAGGALVASGTLPSAQLGVDARAHERVDERERPAGLEDHRLGQRVGGAGGFVAVEVGELAPPGAGSARVAEHGDRASERGAAGRQAPQTGAHGSADTLRAQLAGQAGVLATRRDSAPLELAEELEEQERVAAGRPLAGSDEARIGLRGQQTEPRAS